MIQYTDTIEEITPGQLEGFFVGWLSSPNTTKHLQILKGSSYKWLAMDEETIPFYEKFHNIEGEGMNCKLKMIEAKGNINITPSR